MKKVGLASLIGLALLAGCGGVDSETANEQERMQDAQIAALYSCARNEAYAQGGWMEQPMLEQCLDDWFDANAKRLGVDY